LFINIVRRARLEALHTSLCRDLAVFPIRHHTILQLQKEQVSPVPSLLSANWVHDMFVHHSVHGALNFALRRILCQIAQKKRIPPYQDLLQDLTEW